MAYTKESIFSKVGELLVEINDDYTALSDKNIAESDEVLLLLEAKAKFLASHIEVLRKLTVPIGKVHTPVQVEEGFTPPVVLEGETDKQSVYNEIQEVGEDIDASAPEVEETPVADKREGEEPPLPENPEHIAADEEEPLAPQIQSTPIEEGEQPHQVAEEPKSVVQEEIKFQQGPEEDSKTEVVVNEVVEEPKEIVLEQKQSVPVVEEEKPARPLTLNEILQQQRKAGAMAAMSGTASSVSVGGDKDNIVDLKSSISLNDKLLFIKDLFNGYSLAYSEAIELLNRYATFAEADAFLQTNYALKNNWADKPQTVDKLYAILRKKFML